MRLFECISFCDGIYLVSGVETKLLPNIEKGTIVTVLEEKMSSTNIMGVLLEEDNGLLHPILKVPLMRQKKFFREITEIGEINMEELLTEKV